MVFKRSPLIHNLCIDLIFIRSNVHLKEQRVDYGYTQIHKNAIYIWQKQELKDDNNFWLRESWSSAFIVAWYGKDLFPGRPTTPKYLKKVVSTFYHCCYIFPILFGSNDSFACKQTSFTSYRTPGKDKVQGIKQTVGFSIFLIIILYRLDTDIRETRRKGFSKFIVSQSFSLSCSLCPQLNEWLNIGLNIKCKCQLYNS